MGRKLMRVPMDFDWPLDKVWHGYLTPKELFPPVCTACNYDGFGPSYYTPEAYAISHTFYSHQISWSDRERGDLLSWRDKLGQAEVDNLVAHKRCGVLVADDSKRGSKWTHPPRTAEEINAENRPGVRGLGFGHDSINHSILVKFRCEQLGIPLYCKVCEGHGDTGTPEQREIYENYVGPEPPAGDGYQLWTTTNEGAPISPVFAEMAELCEWAAENATTFADSTATAQQWREMLDKDFVHADMQAADGTKHIFI